MNRRQSQLGFTLLEVMIAMAVFAVVSGALIRNVAQATNQTGILQQRTLAYWIAENQINQMRLQPRSEENFPGIGSERTSVTMVGREWEVVMDIEATENQDMRSIIVSVFTADDGENSIVELTGFIGKH